MALCGSAAAPAQTLDRARELHLEGRQREALEAYAAVIASPTTPEADKAAAANNSCVLRMNLGEHREAIDDCERALAIRRAAADQLPLARTLNNLALALQNLGRYDEAAERYEEALAINDHLDEVEAAAQNVANLAALTIQAGRYAEALRHVARVESLALAHVDEAWAPTQLQIARINRGVVYEKIGAFHEALDSYRLVLSEDPEAIDDRQRALLEVNAGVIYRNLGDPLSALQRFESAARTFRRLEDSSGLANVVLNIALARHLNLERPAAAEAGYREALALATSGGDRPEQIQALFYLGRLLLDLDRPQEARELFERCLDLSRRSDSPEGRWSALAGLGQVALRVGELPRAAEWLEEAMREIEEVRADLRLDTHRADFFGDKRSVFAAAVRVRGELETVEPGAGHGRRALWIVQRAKARTLLDALGTGETGAPLETAELQRTVGDGLLLEYFAAGDDLFRWVVDGEKTRMDNLGAAAPILGRATAVHAALAAGSAPDPELLERLSEELLGRAGGVEPAFELGAGTLHVAADGALRYLPFELLPLPGAGGGILLDRAAIAYLPSGSALSRLAGADPDSELSLLAFGNPVLERTASAEGPAALLTARFGLEPLPASEAELATLADRLEGTSRLYSGPDATEESFREATRRATRVLHLATHTVIDERPGRGAAILLTPAGRDDGLLSPPEIAALDLRARLTVLAACRTALVDDGGDALATLTGAFLAAGSSAVVATLWEVGDRTTAAFMEQLYWELGRGRPAAEALRRTKLRFRGDPGWSRAAAWAPYVLIGSSAPVAPAPALPPLYGWIAAAVVVVAAAFLLLSRLRTRAPRPRARRAADPRPDRRTR